MVKIKTILFFAMIGLFRFSPVDAAEVQFSGFASIIGGTVLHGTLQGPWPANENVKCPCYLADWANFGMYNNSVSLTPESRIGLQATAKLTDDLSATGQLLSRGTVLTPKLQWAYLTYNLGSDWEVQAGRKRIPLSYYSDSQDVGVSYPLIAPSPELYGWEATNYNGINVNKKIQLAGAAVSSSIFTGSETVNNDRYALVQETQPLNQSWWNVSWNNILGTSVEVSKDWLTVRGVYVQANTSFVDMNNPMQGYSQNMRMMGLAANADFDKFFILSEISTNNRTQLADSFNTITNTMAGQGLKVNALAYSVGAGYRLGSWTPFLNYAQYHEWTNNTDLYVPVAFDRASITLRYDLTSGSDIKTQIDRYLEPGSVYTGNSTVFRISYDRVF